jgi:hypothetical protein
LYRLKKGTNVPIFFVFLSNAIDKEIKDIVSSSSLILSIGYLLFCRWYGTISPKEFFVNLGKGRGAESSKLLSVTEFSVKETLSKPWSLRRTKVLANS